MFKARTKRRTWEQSVLYTAVARLCFLTRITSAFAYLTVAPSSPKLPALLLRQLVSSHTPTAVGPQPRLLSSRKSRCGSLLSCWRIQLDFPNRGWVAIISLQLHLYGSRSANPPVCSHTNITIVDLFQAFSILCQWGSWSAVQDFFLRGNTLLRKEWQDMQIFVAALLGLLRWSGVICVVL